MFKKLVVTVLITIMLSVLVLTTQTAQPASSQYTIGVKPGDWIEYNVTTTGTPPDEKHIVWARTDILNITGDTFTANTTGQSPNGTYSSFVRTFNFEKGDVSAWIIIPANLNVGDSFYDSFDNQNYSIGGEKQATVAGATRTITYIDSMGRHKEWDKATGVFVETNDNVGNYTVEATAYATNMWNPQILGLDQNVFYAVVAIVAVVIVLLVVAVLLVGRRRMKKT